MMLSFILATVTGFQDPYVAPEYLQRHCAAVVGIPYASDNFTEEEWHQYMECIGRHLRNQTEV